jgi:hypothetical protein
MCRRPAARSGGLRAHRAMAAAPGAIALREVS